MWSVVQIYDLGNGAHAGTLAKAMLLQELSLKPSPTFFVYTKKDTERFIPYL